MKGKKLNTISNKSIQLEIIAKWCFLVPKSKGTRTIRKQTKASQLYRFLVA
jgi:hypothetical protein